MDLEISKFANLEFVIALTGYELFENQLVQILPLIACKISDPGRRRIDRVPPPSVGDGLCYERTLSNRVFPVAGLIYSDMIPKLPRLS